MSKLFKDDLKGSSLASIGWLFADLLLALTMLFMAANTIGIRPAIPPPPTLTVNPVRLDPNHCRGGVTNPQCTVTVGETANSHGSVDWTASSDMSDSIVFRPAKGTLSPGKSVSVTIAAFPCQNGSFTFSGSRRASSVTVLWRCTLPPPTAGAAGLQLPNIQAAGT